MSPPSIQTWCLFPIIHLSGIEWQVLVPVCYEFGNVVRGQHVYKSAWTPLTDKSRKSILQEDNEHDNTL